MGWTLPLRTIHLHPLAQAFKLKGPSSGTFST